jgi:hypothetical protein
MKLLKSKYILIEDSKRSLINLYREQIKRLKRKVLLVTECFQDKVMTKKNRPIKRRFLNLNKYTLSFYFIILIENG